MTGCKQIRSRSTTAKIDCVQSEEKSGCCSVDQSPILYIAVVHYGVAHREALIDAKRHIALHAKRHIALHVNVGGCPSCSRNGPGAAGNAVTHLSSFLGEMACAQSKIGRSKRSWSTNLTYIPVSLLQDSHNRFFFLNSRRLVFSPPSLWNRTRALMTMISISSWNSGRYHFLHRAFSSGHVNLPVAAQRTFKWECNLARGNQRVYLIMIVARVGSADYCRMGNFVSA